MSLIDEIEAELNDLAEPQWRRSEYGFTRIKLLVNYVKAAEKYGQWFSKYPEWKPNSDLIEYFDVDKKAWQDARKALGLEESER